MTSDHVLPTVSQSSTSTESSSPGCWHDTLWLCAFVMFGLIAMSRSKADPDLWGHVTYGKEVIRDGHLHDKTTWSYAVDDFRWVNHENIAELALAAADSFGGQAGLLLLKSVLTIIVLGLPVWVAYRRGAGLLACFGIVVLLATNISFHWLIRPHMFSYACGAILMGVLATSLPGAIAARGDAQRFSKWLWLLPPLMCFWTNAHGGYLAGMAILMAWLGLDAIELMLQRDQRFWPTVRHHAILFLATVAACMINPYGMELHQWMLSSLGRPRPEISEWAPLPLFTTNGLPFWGIVLVAFLCLKRSDKPIRWPGMIVMALLSWQAVKHYRHLPFVAMMASYVLAPHLESLIRRMRNALQTRLLSLQSHYQPQSKRRQPARAGAIVGGVLLLVLSVLQYPNQATLHVDKSFYPVGAMQFMEDNQLGGKVFVTFNWAQYALAVFSENDSDSRIAFDGRFRTCYPQHVIDMYFDFILGDLPSELRYRDGKSGPFDPACSLDYKNPNLVLFERRRQNCVSTMQASEDDWCLLYQDSVAQLWGRRSVYDDVDSRQFLAASRRIIGDASQDESVAWPAFPIRRSQIELPRVSQLADVSL